MRKKNKHFNWKWNKFYRKVGKIIRNLFSFFYWNFYLFYVIFVMISASLWSIQWFNNYELHLSWTLNFDCHRLNYQQNQRNQLNNFIKYKATENTLTLTQTYSYKESKKQRIQSKRSKNKNKNAITNDVKGFEKK